jgi:alkylglycerol monooxygenase
MDQTVILLVATPLVLLLALVEGLVGRWMGRRVYRFEATINDLLQALGHLVVTTVTRVGPLFAYAWVHDHLALFHLPVKSPLTWVGGFVLIDGLFYLRHRSLHRVAILWASHRIHHESHQYNYAVAQRNGWLVEFMNWPLVAVAAVIGLPIEVATACIAINHTWQLFLHTELVPRIRAVEWFLSTPSGHRVHHASNTTYIDKNYGGVFTVWDHVFGTWEAEVEAPIFGTIHPMTTWDPIENNVSPMVELFEKAAATATVLGWLRVVFGPPSWEEGVGELPPPPPEPRIDPPSSDDREDHVVTGAGFALATVLTAMLMALGPQMDALPRLAAGVGILALLWAVGRGLAPRPVPLRLAGVSVT